MHVCNWPERQPFLKILFSTEKFNDVAAMDVYTPAGEFLVSLNKNRFKKIVGSNKQEKRVFILDIDVPDGMPGGWYTLRVKTVDGKQYSAKDFVPLIQLGRVTGMQPSSDKSSVSLPLRLSWDKVEGAGFYKVFIRDTWTGESVLKTALVSDNWINVPPGILSPGGDYSWSVHARDTNEHILLGDFHMGSLSKKASFQVAE